jgi:hypothetical protein
MQSIERIDSAPHIEANGANGHIVTMRDFLADPRVARSFQDLKSDAQRLRAAGAEREAMAERSANAELDAGRKARANDDYRHHRLAFGVGVFLAAMFVALDALPANLAAQTFGLDQAPTWGITAVIVGALGAGMWAVTHYRAGWRRTVTIAAVATGLFAIGALRFWFLWVTAGDPLAAVLEAAALTVFTTMMVWLGILVLGFTKPRAVSAAESAARRFARRAERKATEEKELLRHLEAARSEFLADAQLYSFRAFHNDPSRSQFLDYVRAELAR